MQINATLLEQRRVFLLILLAGIFICIICAVQVIQHGKGCTYAVMKSGFRSGKTNYDGKKRHCGCFGAGILQIKLLKQLSREQKFHSLSTESHSLRPELLF